MVNRNGGRKPLSFTQQQHDMVRTILGFGATIEDCRKMLSSDRNDGTILAIDTFRKHFEHEINTAKTEANMKVVQALFKAAVKNGNVNAQKFWLQCQAGWIPTEERKHTGDGIPIEFTFNVAGNVKQGDGIDG